MSGILGLGNWWGNQGAQPGAQQATNPLTGYADRMRAAGMGGPGMGAPQSPLVAAYTPPAYQTTPPHVDIDAVIAAMNAQKAGAQAGAPAMPAGIPGMMPGEGANNGVGDALNGDAGQNAQGAQTNANVGGTSVESVGYAQGGQVTGDRLSGGPSVRQYSNDDRSLIDDARNAAPQNNETSARWNAAMDAATGARYNELSPEEQAKFREYLQQTTGRTDILGGERDLDHARASYPGFKGGGPVTGAALAGPDPAGPDAGYAALQPGEYVIKKDAAAKVGKKTLSKINDGDNDSAEIANEVTRRVAARHDGKGKR